ncbi:low molecular weight phosphotyrosine protein phosphatase [Simkania sp.]|uniref:arsenate reductase/protein-tyrosine-phosphatase family protein n=1 Tax=Simkania sp. TaxID=34094 RepID=UPI003B51B096
MNHLALQKGVSDQVYIDSCGLHSSFLGSAPDARMQRVAKEKGITFTHQAKMFEPAFFDTFQAIFGVTEEIVSHLRSLAHTPEEKAKVHLATTFSENFKGMDIPDPYYLGAQGFEKIWEIIEDACNGIFDEFIHA